MDAADHCHYAALAVGSAYQRSTQVALRPAKLVEEAIDALETQADAEPSARLELGDRGRVIEGQLSRPRPRRRRNQGRFR